MYCLTFTRTSPTETILFPTRWGTLPLARISPTEPVLFHTGCSTLPLARISPTKPVLFHTGCNTLPLARISPTKLVLFHTGCSTLPLARISLQSQSFFILDVAPCLCKDFHYRSSPFSYWMQYSALISEHGRPSSTMSKRPSTYI